MRLPLGPMPSKQKKTTSGLQMSPHKDRQNDAQSLRPPALICCTPGFNVWSLNTPDLAAQESPPSSAFFI